MKTNEIAKKGLYVGTGAGIVLFALAGLLPGSLIGGVIGLQVSESIFGGPMGSALLPRMILAVCMITGVVVSALVCILGTGMLGWSLGFVVDALKSREEAAAEMATETKR
jgi:hypothetical protein